MSDPTPDTPSGGNILNKKIGGIKTPYLIGIGVAAAVGVYYWRKRATQNNPTPPTVVDTSGQAGGPFSSTSGGGGGSSGASSGAGSGSTPVQQTNAQWARQSLNSAIGNGTVDATDGANAVTAWLNGQQLTAGQRAIIAKLTTAYGQPPEGVLPIGPGTNPVDNSPSAYVRNSAGQISAVTGGGSSYVLSLPEWDALSAQGANFTQLTDTNYTQTTHRYVVQPGDTWTNIAERFYKTPAHAPRAGSPLTVGSTIEIPLNEVK